MNALAAGIVAGLAVAVPLGAIGVLIVDLGVRGGFRPAFLAGLGTALADGLYATVAAVAGLAVGAWLAPAEHAIALVAPPPPSASRAAARARPLTAAAPPPVARALTAVNPATRCLRRPAAVAPPRAARRLRRRLRASLAWQTTRSPAAAPLMATACRRRADVDLRAGQVLVLRSPAPSAPALALAAHARAAVGALMRHWPARRVRTGRWTSVAGRLLVLAAGAARRSRDLAWCLRQAQDDALAGRQQQRPRDRLAVALALGADRDRALGRACSRARRRG